MRRDGFTLVELLSTIVIIALIALIATPLILGIIEKAEKWSFRNTAYGLIKTAEYEHIRLAHEGNQLTLDYRFSDYKLDSEFNLEYKGKSPKSGIIKIKGDGKSGIAIHNGKYCAKKEYEEPEVTVEKIEEEYCMIPGEELYDLTLLVRPEGSGITLGGASYDPGQTVSILAEPVEGNTFVRWEYESGDVFSENIEAEVEMNTEHITLVAVFSGTNIIEFNEEQFTLSLTSSPEYAVSHIGLEGVYQKNEYAEVTFNQNSSFSNYEFDGWYDEIGNKVSSVRSFNHKMTRNITLRAVFKQNNEIVFVDRHMLKLNTSPVGSGITVGYGMYESGEQVLIYTEGDENHNFVHWITENGSILTNQEEIITMPSRTTTITAIYTPKAEFINEIEELEKALTMPPGSGGQQVSCLVLPFHFEKEVSQAKLKLDCNGTTDYVDVNFSDFEYKLNNGISKKGLEYSNNERVQKYHEVNGRWTRVKHGNPPDWNVCLQNEYRSCSGFPNIFEIKGVTIKNQLVNIVLWKTNEVPYNLESPAIYKGYPVELSRVSTPKNVGSGLPFTGENGSVTIYEAPVYKGYAGLVEDNEPPVIVIDGKNLLFTNEVSSFDLMEGVTITDDSGIEPDVMISGNLSTLNNYYKITYTATDRAGNQNSMDRIIVVTDNYTPDSCFNFNESTNTVTGYNIGTTGCGGDVLIPPTITKNGNTFEVSNVGREAFKDAELTSLVFVGNINNINEEAFSSPKFKYVLFLGEVSNIDDYAFAETFNSTNNNFLGFARNVNNIGKYAFRANNINEILFEKDVLYVNDGAFLSSTISTVKFQGSVNELGPVSFNGAGLTDLIFKENVNMIGQHAFGGHNLETLIIDATINIIEEFAFSNGNLETLIINAEIGEIRGHSFRSSNVRTLIINNEVGKIGVFAFADNNMENLIINGDIGEIEHHSFSGNSFKTLEFNSDIGKIWNHSFPTSYYNPGNVELLTFKGKIGEIGEHSFNGNQFKKVVFEDDVGNIGEWSFGNSNINELIFKGDVDYIGAWSFSDNDINKLTFQGKVKTISTGSFARNNLTFLTIPEGTEEIGDIAFSNNKITSLTLPGTVKNIGYGSFQDNQLTSVKLPHGVVNIGGSSFANNQLTSIVIPASVNFIDYGAFSGNYIIQGQAISKKPLNQIVIESAAFDRNGLNGDEEITLIYQP